MPEQDHKWLTLPEVAAWYRKPEKTIRHWRLIGYGPKGVRVGTSVLYSRRAVEEFDRQLAAQAAAGRA